MNIFTKTDLCIISFVILELLMANCGLEIKILLLSKEFLQRSTSEMKQDFVMKIYNTLQQ